MSNQTLADKLEDLDPGTDFQDPNVYADLLGYNDESAPEAQAPQGETEPAAAAPAEQPQSSPAPAAAEKPEGEIAGALTKDGKHVIPYSVVQDLRTTTATQAARIAELTASIERMQAEVTAKANGTPTESTGEAPQFSAAELDDMADFPVLAKLVQGYRALEAELQSVKATQAAPAAARGPSASDIEATQAAIDTQPLLSKWQAKGGELWAQAVALDTQLQSDPQWAGKPMTERFAEVQRRVANEYGFSVPSASSGPAPAPKPGSTPTPEAREVLPTLTDFGGGAVAAADPTSGMTRGQMVDRAMNLSVEEIRKSVGLTY